MIEVEKVLKSLEFCGDKHIREAHYHHLFMMIWIGEPLLCIDNDGSEVLAVVTDIGGDMCIFNMRIKDFLENVIRTVSSTVLEVKARFESWEEAKEYFNNKASEAAETKERNSIYVEEARKRTSA